MSYIVQVQGLSDSPNFVLSCSVSSDHSEQCRTRLRVPNKLSFSPSSSSPLDLTWGQLFKGAQ